MRGDETMSVGEATEPQNQIPRMKSKLADAIDLLQASIGDLEKMLVDYMLDTGAQGEGEGPTPKPQICEAADFLVEKTNQLDVATQRVFDIFKKLQL